MDDFSNFDPLLNGSKGLIFIGDKVLIYRRDANTQYYPLFLDLPGGGAEKDETPFETFRREVKEEFGLTITPTNIVYVKRYPSVRFPGENVYFPVAKLTASAAQQINFGNEGLEYLLVEIETFLDATDVCPELQPRTQEYLATLK